MSLNPQIQDLGAKVKLTWTSDLTGEGYAFTVDGVRVSRTFRSDANSTTFQKPSSGTHRYGVQKMDAIDPLEEASWPAAPDPDPGPDLGDLWDAPALSNPLIKNVSNAAPSIAKGSGQDLRVVFSGDLDRAIGQIEGYNDVVIENFRIIGGTEMSQGHIVPRENTGTFFMKNGRMELDTKWTSDAITARWRTPILRIVNCHISVTCGVLSGSSWSRPADPHHADGYQTQQAMHNELGFDKCTFVTDYQGILLLNEPSALAGERARVDKCIISRTLFKPGRVGYPATWFFKSYPPKANTDPPGITEMYDVWAPLQDILAHVYPHGHTWRDWAGQGNKYGCFLETKRHPKLGKDFQFARFSTSADKVPAGKPLAGQQCGDCKVIGDGGIWCYQNLSEVPAYVGSKGV